MSWLYFALIFTILSSVTAQGLLSTFLNDNKSDILRKKCETNSANKLAYIEIMKAMESLPNCTKSALGEMVSPLDDFEGYCNYIKNVEYYKCVKEVVDKLDVCLEKDEKYLSGLLLSTLNSSLIEYCKSDAIVAVKELIGLLENEHCISHTLRMVIYVCFQDLKITQKFGKGDYVVRKDDICGDLEALSTCTSSFMIHDCKKDLTKTVDIFFKPNLDWCKAHV